MNNGKRFLLGILVIQMVLSVSTAAFALGDDTAMTKLERGMLNLSTGWMELFVQPYEAARGEQPMLGTFFGLGTGILKGLQRTGLGLADTVTFPLSPYDRPVMEPETLFGEPH